MGVIPGSSQQQEQAGQVLHHGLLLLPQASSSPLPSNIIFPDTVVCLTSTATPQDFQLADPNNCTVFWHCRWDGSTSVHTAVKGECSEGETYRQGVGCVRGTCKQ